LLFGSATCGVGLLQRFDLFGRAAHDPHRLAAPFDRELLARLERADVHLDGAPAALARSDGAKLADEGHRGGHATHGGTTRDTDPGTSAGIDGILAH
jgi:hypothetical protein